MPRNLVSCRWVNSKSPFPHDNSIECVQIGGWLCRSPRDQFSVGELVVFFEIDSFLPSTDPRYSFLSDEFIEWDGLIGFRVKTIEYHGQIFQGLVMPLGLFPEIENRIQQRQKGCGLSINDFEQEVATEENLKKLLNIKKWTPSAMLNEPGFGKASNAIPSVPSFIRPLHQDRVQNRPDILQKHRHEVFQETTKMEGYPVIVYYVHEGSQHFKGNRMPYRENGTKDMAYQPSFDTENFGISSTKLGAPVALCTFWTMQWKSLLYSKLVGYRKSIALQGELVGDGIMGNLEGFEQDTRAFFLYAVWDIDAQVYFTPRHTEEIALWLGIDHVPVLGYHKLRDIAITTNDLIARADGLGINGKEREGVVFKREDGHFGFKIISSSYLLKHGL
ncbi:RNA ligase, DRB0094 family [Leptodontidium sp. MPI-SDFR-AT-0119]|nr:RNA ligase, DRB0094 family [Leptodontidium sp. MPI-SDFR-AT-0119]